MRARTTAAATAALLAAPAAAGVVGAVVLRLQAPTLDLLLVSPLWTVLLVAGPVLTALLAVPFLWRWRTARARVAGATQAAQEAAQNHRRFLLRLDHELKNPVTAMQAGVANVAAELEGAGPNAATALDSVASQTRRLAELVADLRKLAELETRPLEQDPVDLAELLAEMLELTDAADRTVALTLPQAPWPLTNVVGDRDLLFLAFYNLLGNAVKFTRPGDTIEVRAHDDGDRVVVEVADTGAGIPADEVAQVWEELARGRAARGTPGMGLGLAMVRAVVTRHGGTATVRSREGHGTVMVVRLPVAGAARGTAGAAGG